MYFDSHVHLNSEQLYPERDLFIAKALEKGVDTMLVVGYDMESSKLAVELANLYDFLYAAVAIGPNDCGATTMEEMRVLEKYLEDPKVVAIGETGLDYYWDHVAASKQKEVFQWHIDLAKKHNLPLSIHCRDAYEDTYTMLKQASHFGVMHCYSGSAQMAQRFVDIGFKISLAGTVTFKNARVPKEVAGYIQIEDLLIETDCPYLTPHPYRGKLNEPANVIYVAKEIAKIKNLEIEDVGNITEFNAKKLFGIK